MIQIMVRNREPASPVTMSADVLIFKPVFRSIPLEWKDAARALPLVQLVDPRQTVQDWTSFVRSQARAGRAGVQAIEDGRGYLHAVFLWQIERRLVWQRTLRVSGVVLGGLPGRAARDAVLTAIRELARGYKSDSIVVEASDDAGSLGRETLLASGYSPFSTAAFVQRVAESH